MARLKTQTQLEQERLESVRYLLGNFILPTDKALLIYARQSTVKQVLTNVYSAMQQTEDLLERGVALGWKREQATLFVENRLATNGKIKSVSGTIPIEDRPGISTIVEHISAGTVGALMCVDVSRLTRDADLVDAVTLAKRCKDNHVVIITNDSMFDFNNPTRNDLDAYLEEAKAAAAFIEKHVKGKMLKNRSKKANIGLLANGVAAVGLMRDETGNSLTPSPHASNVARLYSRYHELNASLALLYREVVGKVIFPDVPGVDPRTIYLARVPGGWTIASRKGLKHILTNPSYAGHLVFNGRIVKRDAHTAIVPIDDWQYAFTHLADVDLDGVPFDRGSKAVRYLQKGNTNTALLSGTRHDGTLVLSGVGSKHVYYNQASWGSQYVIKNTQQRDINIYESGIGANDLDAIFVDRLLFRLEARGEDVASLARYIPTFETEGASTQAVTDMGELTREIASVERKLHVASDVMDDGELRSNYERLARLRTRKTNLEHRQENEARLRAELEQARRDIPTAVDKWGTWTLARQRAFIQLVTESITLETLADGWFRFSIAWCELLESVPNIQVAETAYIWRQSGSQWDENESGALRANYSTASRGTLLQLFPRRSWSAIKSKGKELRLRRPTMPTDTTLPEHMSLSDVRIAQEFCLPLEEPEKRVWWHLGVSLKGDTPS